MTNIEFEKNSFFYNKTTEQVEIKFCIVDVSSGGAVTPSATTSATTYSINNESAVLFTGSSVSAIDGFYTQVIDDTTSSVFLSNGFPTSLTLVLNEGEATELEEQFSVHYNEFVHGAVNDLDSLVVVGNSPTTGDPTKGVFIQPTSGNTLSKCTTYVVPTSSLDESHDFSWRNARFVNASKKSSATITSIDVGDLQISNHICDHYVVEAVNTNPLNTGTGWTFRLFEGINDFRRILTYDYLSGLPTGSIIGTMPAPEDFADLLIVFDDTNGWWNICKISTTSIVGHITQSFPITGDTYDNAIYKVYYDTNLSEFSTECEGCFLANTSNSTSFMKGRLLAVEGNNGTLALNSDVTFSVNGKAVLSFSFNSDSVAGLFDAGVRGIDITVSDATTFEEMMASDNVESFDHTVSENETQVALLFYNEDYDESTPSTHDLQRALGGNYINGLYRVLVVPEDVGGVCYYPYSKDCRIVYFHDTITLEFANGGASYINSISGRLAKIPFTLKYESDGVKEEVVGLPLNFSTIEGAYYGDGVDGIGDIMPETYNPGDTFNYPFRWSDNTKGFTGVTHLDEENNMVSSNAEVTYDSEEGLYYLNVPFGMSNVPAGEYIFVDNGVEDDDSHSLGGYYALTENQSTESEKVYKHTTKNLYLRNIQIAALGTEIDWNNYSFQAVLGGNSGNVFKTWAITDTTGVSYNTTNVKAISVHYIPANDQNALDATGVDESFVLGYVTSFSDISAQQASGEYPGAGTLTQNALIVRNGVGNFLKRDGSDQHGMKHSIYFRLKDGYENITTIENTEIQVHQVLPNMLVLDLIGSSGNTNYTGFYQKHGRFFPSEYISLSFSAHSDIKMSYEIVGSRLKSPIYGKNLSDGLGYRHLVKVNPKSLNSETFSNTADVSIAVTLRVTDEAGNYSETTSTIQYISKLFRTTHPNLREPSVDYSHRVYINEATLVNERTIGTDFTRSWNEIWYPETHGMPVNEKGEINEVAALRISKGTSVTDAEKALYDKLALATGGVELAIDEDGRYVQDVQSWSPTKRYPARENARLVNNKYQTYWIIENTNGNDFQLEFEVFDFSSQITKYPENLCARYTGDSLSVFDASDPDCVYENPIADSEGRKKWILKDSTKLSHLFSLKGSGFNSNTNPITLLDSEEIGNAIITGTGVTCPGITQCSRICIVPFSDYGTDDSSRGTGFKLKAGPKHFNEDINYEYINVTGEFWVHIAPTSQGAKYGSSNSVGINYEYYESVATVKCDEALVKFNKRNIYPLLSTFSCYNYLYTSKSGASPLDEFPYPYFSRYVSGNDNGSHCLKSLVSSQDDFVDYANCSFYCTYLGDTPTKGTLYDSTTSNSSGKLISYLINKDAGIITFSTPPPLGRIFADYYYHTFYRLTSDGYGDLYFYGSGILVPASTTSQYTDWTYVDLKITNEGSNTLIGGQLMFLARGYVTKGTVVDTVLDHNRPWDVQEGTTAETVSRTGAYCESSYSTLGASHPLTRANAFQARSNQTCSLGTIEPKKSVFVRVFWCIANNAQGTAWVDVVKGSKTYSAELSGSYYIFTS